MVVNSSKSLILCHPAEAYTHVTPGLSARLEWAVPVGLGNLPDEPLLRHTALITPWGIHLALNEPRFGSKSRPSTNQISWFLRTVSEDRQPNPEISKGSENLDRLTSEGEVTKSSWARLSLSDSQVGATVPSAVSRGVGCRQRVRPRPCENVHLGERPSHLVRLVQAQVRGHSACRSPC